jgi:hypothetical protein
MSAWTFPFYLLCRLVHILLSSCVQGRELNISYAVSLLASFLKKLRVWRYTSFVVCLYTAAPHPPPLSQLLIRDQILFLFMSHHSWEHTSPLAEGRKNSRHPIIVGRGLSIVVLQQAHIHFKYYRNHCPSWLTLALHASQWRAICIYDVSFISGVQSRINYIRITKYIVCIHIYCLTTLT